MMLSICVWLLALAFAALQALDAYTTVRILGSGGTELNPVLAWLFAHVGVIATLAAMKIIVVAGAVVLARFVTPTFAFAILALLVAAYVWVVVHNTQQIKST